MHGTAPWSTRGPAGLAILRRLPGRQLHSLRVTHRCRIPGYSIPEGRLVVSVCGTLTTEEPLSSSQLMNQQLVKFVILNSGNYARGVLQLAYSTDTNCFNVYFY